MIQQGLFDGDARRDRAIERVDANAPVGWVDATTKIIHDIAVTKTEFTTDDVWSVQRDSPPEPRAMGAAMTRAAKRGWIQATDRVQKSKRPECHSRPIRIWKSNL